MKKKSIFKSTFFTENLLKKYSKIEFIYVQIKIPVVSKSIPRLSIQKSSLNGNPGPCALLFPLGRVFLLGKGV